MLSLRDWSTAAARVRCGCAGSKWCRWQRPLFGGGGSIGPGPAVGVANRAVPAGLIQTCRATQGLRPGL